MTENCGTEIIFKGQALSKPETRRHISHFPVWTKPVRAGGLGLLWALQRRQTRKIYLNMIDGYFSRKLFLEKMNHRGLSTTTLSLWEARSSI